jgi:hypothetical protein
MNTLVLCTPLLDAPMTREEKLSNLDAIIRAADRVLVVLEALEKIT